MIRPNKRAALVDTARRLMSTEERLTEGKALRDKIPREYHGQWKEEKGRLHPIAILNKSDNGRMKDLVSISDHGLATSDLSSRSLSCARFRERARTDFCEYRETLSEDRRMLLDRYRLIDAAINVVGVGSVGRRCWIALLMSETNSLLSLQFEEAVDSVLEPYAGKSIYSHHGQRVVMGQRLMQTASDIFLGWVTAPNGRHFHVRQLRDAKIKPLVETCNQEMLDVYAVACGWVLARAHSTVNEISGTIRAVLVHRVTNSTKRWEHSVRRTPIKPSMTMLH